MIQCEFMVKTNLFFDARRTINDIKHYINTFDIIKHPKFMQDLVSTHSLHFSLALVFVLHNMMQDLMYFPNNASPCITTRLTRFSPWMSQHHISSFKGVHRKIERFQVCPPLSLLIGGSSNLVAPLRLKINKSSYLAFRLQFTQNAKNTTQTVLLLVLRRSLPESDKSTELANSNSKLLYRILFAKGKNIDVFDMARNKLRVPAKVLRLKQNSLLYYFFDSP